MLEGGEDEALRWCVCVCGLTWIEPSERLNTPHSVFLVAYPGYNY